MKQCASGSPILFKSHQVIFQFTSTETQVSKRQKCGLKDEEYKMGKTDS